MTWKFTLIQIQKKLSFCIEAESVAINYAANIQAVTMNLKECQTSLVVSMQLVGPVAGNVTM